MKYFLLLLLPFMLLGQPSPQQGSISFSQAPPTPPASLGASVIGPTGGTVYNYWVVAKYIGGNSAPAGPAIVRNGPLTLSGTNYIQIGWSSVSGAIGYDVLRTLTATLPTGTSNIALAYATPATSTVDIGAPLGAYTISIASGATGNISLDNRNYLTPTFNFDRPISVPGGIIGAGLVPYIGATADVNLGLHTITGAANATNLIPGLVTMSTPGTSVAVATNDPRNTDSRPPGTYLNVSTPLAYDSTTGNVSCPTCNTGTSSPQYTGNALISGGSVIWDSGLTFTVGAATYLINGIQYTSPLTSLTLPAADGANPRIDGIALDITGNAVILNGSADPNPVNPVSDPSSQLPLTFIWVPTGSATPANTSSALIYDENVGGPGEWAATESTAGVRIALGSLVNPYKNAKDINATAVIAADTITLTPALAITPSNYNYLVFYIRSKAAWPKQKSIQIYFATGATRVGQIVAFQEGSFGFVSATTAAYQQVAIPIGLFNVPTTADKLIMKVAGGGASIGFYLDYITLQTGVAPTVTRTHHTVEFSFDGGGSAITVGKVAYTRVPFGCTITDWSVMSDTAEVVTFHLWLLSGGTAIPTIANNVNTAGVGLTAGTAKLSSVVTDFTTLGIAKDSWAAAQITAVTAATQAQFMVGCLE